MKPLSSHVPVPTIQNPKHIKNVPEPFEAMEINEFKFVNNTRKIHYPLMLKKYEMNRIDDSNVDDFRNAIKLIVKKKDND